MPDWEGLWPVIWKFLNWERIPASLSAHVIDNLLCRELGFRGLVFTDALEMKGVSQNENLCAKALKAGNDFVVGSSQSEKRTERSIGSRKKVAGFLKRR